MGLGKTVQMIATMAMNMPNSEDKCRVTLTVVPAALMQQARVVLTWIGLVDNSPYSGRTRSTAKVMACLGRISIMGRINSRFDSSSPTSPL